jgi:hypothetical protein
VLRSASSGRCVCVRAREGLQRIHRHSDTRHGPSLAIIHEVIPSSQMLHSRTCSHAARTHARLLALSNTHSFAHLGVLSLFCSGHSLTSIACPKHTHLLTHPPTRAHTTPPLSLSRPSMKTRLQTRIGPCHLTLGQQRRCFVERSPSVVSGCGCVVPPLTPPLLSNTRAHTHTSTHIHHLAHPPMC